MPYPHLTSEDRKNLAKMCTPEELTKVIDFLNTYNRLVQIQSAIFEHSVKSMKSEAARLLMTDGVEMHYQCLKDAFESD